MRRRTVRWMFVLAILAAFVGGAVVAPVASAATLSTRTIWVDPVRGKDARSGATRATALRTLTAAWNKIPARTALRRPYRIMITAGRIPAAASPNYWESRWGSTAAPISIVSADGPGRAELPSMNVFDVRYLTLDGVRVRSQFDPFHCEQCANVTLRRSQFVGVGDPTQLKGPQETIKINQSEEIRILDSYVAGATDNAIDLVAVDTATIARTTIANAQDWCAYAKGGSSDIEFVANHVHHCGTGGITLGQGTGFEFMRAPWFNYEVYGGRAINNVIHDVEGAALGVNGGFAALLAYNTAYRVGTRDHVLEVVFGERSCDGNAAACAALRTAGGWGPTAPGGDPAPIGNRQVAVFHNLIHNPAGVQSQWQHFAVYGPRPANGSGGPDPAIADDSLLIRGNAIQNGPADLALGLGEDGQGCQPSHPTCAPDAVRAANDINQTAQPVRVVASAAPVPTGVIAAGTGAGAALPAFEWVGLPNPPDEPAAPFVTMPSAVTVDRAGRARLASAWRPGAYVAVPATTLVRVRGYGVRGQVKARGQIQGRLKSFSYVGIRGDYVELVATPNSLQRFYGWTGACAGQLSNTCVLKLNRAVLDAGVRFGWPKRR